MAVVSLSKALKLKNRQIQKVRQIQERIQRSNTYIEGSEPDFDTKALLVELYAETERLWRLKHAINEANIPVHGAIYELAETKGLVTFFRTLNTTRGKVPMGYMTGEPQEYEAQITAQQALDEITTLEARIDELQDVLDRHNATVQIEVPD